MKVTVIGMAVVDVHERRLDQLVDDPTDLDAVKAVLQAMVDRGDRWVIEGWWRDADIQIDEVTP